MPFGSSLVSLALAATSVVFASIASADTTHVVARGHTIEAIAHRYHVSVKSIVDANHLTDHKHLKVGQVLVIPGVSPKSDGTSLAPPGRGRDKEKKDKDGARAGRVRSKPKDEKKNPNDAASSQAAAALATVAPPKPEPDVTRASLERGRNEGASQERVSNGVIHAVARGEEFKIRVKDSRGHIPTATLKAFERMMRQGNATHAVDPRLVALVSIVSSHFGGKPIEVVSGYRAFSPTQYTAHSNHNFGKALDFRVRGVPNETLRDFCRTLRNAGCGYYPNSTFVHLDVRDTKTFWIDYSHPGEPPQYDKPGVAADEGASDVPDDSVPSAADTTAAPPADPNPS
jgi:uncharacterized protein YcbK (DUF882 family)